MKLYVLIVGASFFASVTVSSEDKPAGNVHYLSTHRIHTGVFGGTYSYAKKHGGNTHGIRSDHSKHQIHGGSDHTLGKEKHEHGGQRDIVSSYRDPIFNIAFGHVDHGKGTYVGKGNRKESGGILSDYAPGKLKDGEHESKLTSSIAEYENHGSQVHNEKAVSINGGGKRKNGEEIGGYGSSASGKHQIGKYQVHETGPIEEHGNHGSQGYEGGRETYGGENGGDRGESEGLGSFASGKHDEGKYEVKETSGTGEYSHHGSLGHGNGKGTYGGENGGEREVSGGLGSYASGKHDEGKYEVKETSGIGEYTHHGSQGHENGKRTYGGHNGGRGEIGGLGDYALGEHGSHTHKDGKVSYEGGRGSDAGHGSGKHHGDDKHEGKLPTSIGKYGTDEGQHDNDKGTHWHGNSGFEDYFSGTYDVGKYEVHDRYDEDYNKRKYEGWTKTDERKVGSGDKGYDVKER